MKRLVLVLLILGLFLSGVPVSVGGGKDDADLSRAVKAVDDLAAAEFARYSQGSITVGVVHDKKLIWTKSYGYADIEKKELATKDSVYRIGGMSVKFTGLMLLQLVEAGKIALDDPVEKYFPEIKTIQGYDSSVTPVTFKQLAMQTSAIANEPDDAPTYTRGPVSEWERTLIAALPHTKFVGIPGAKYVYSNVGNALLGAALARVAGEPYVSYVEKKIFAPLGMKHTSFEPNAATRPKLAKGYVVYGGQIDGSIPEREHQGRGYKVPSGAVYTTVEDLARYLSFELGEGPESVLKKKTLEENYRHFLRVKFSTDEITGYGVGFQLLGCKDLEVFGYGGFVPGYHARSDIVRSAGIGFIVLRNVEGGSMHESTRRFVCHSLSELAAAGRQNSGR